VPHCVVLHRDRVLPILSSRPSVAEKIAHAPKCVRSCSALLCNITLNAFDTIAPGHSVRSECTLAVVNVWWNHTVRVQRWALARINAIFPSATLHIPRHRLAAMLARLQAWKWKFVICMSGMPTHSSSIWRQYHSCVPRSECFPGRPDQRVRVFLLERNPDLSGDWIRTASFTGGLPSDFRSMRLPTGRAHANRCLLCTARGAEPEFLNHFTNFFPMVVFVNGDGLTSW